MITAPDAILNSKELASTKLPIKVLVAPKAINTIEKPIVKSVVGIMFTRLLSNNSFKVLPETYEIYPGISGKTQGDRKLIKPAKKANNNCAIYNF